MRSLLLIIIANVIGTTSFPIYSMNALTSYFSKKADPMAYIMQGESVEHCKEVLRLDPEHPDHLKFERSSKWIGKEEINNDGHIGKAVRRHLQMSVELEGSIFGYDDRWFCFWGTYRKPNHAVAELIMQANSSEKVDGYFSAHAIAVLRAYFKLRVNQNATDAASMESYVPQQVVPIASPSLQVSEAVKSSAKESEKQAFRDPTTFETFKDLVLKDNVTWYEALNNYLSKNYTDSLGHLTHLKTEIFSTKLLRYDPNHPGHNDAWQMSPETKLHARHVHKTFERERILSALVNIAVVRDNHETIAALNPFSQSNPYITKISKDYYPPILLAIIKGYLAHKAAERNVDRPFPLLPPPPPAGKNPANPNSQLPPPSSSAAHDPGLAQDGKCSCNPPKSFKDCVTCNEKAKKLIDDHTAGTRQQDPPPALGSGSSTQTDSRSQTDPAQKPANDSKANLNKPLPPLPPAKGQLVESSTLCSCNPPKKLVDCFSCISKLVKQPSQ